MKQTIEVDDVVLVLWHLEDAYNVCREAEDKPLIELELEDRKGKDVVAIYLDREEKQPDEYLTIVRDEPEKIIRAVTACLDELG